LGTPPRVPDQTHGRRAIKYNESFRHFYANS